MSPRSLLLAFAIVAAACDSSGTATSPPPATGGPLIPGTWYLHEADGDTLPALISTRIVGVAQEKTFLDSATLVLRADLTYEQRYWTRVLVTEQLDRTDAVVDNGTFTAEGNGFRLTSSIRTRAFFLSVLSLGTIATQEQMLFFANAAPITAGVYRLTRP